jgi:hypothetical protein
MKEVKDSVSGEGGHDQPNVVLESCHRQREKSSRYGDLERQRPRELPMTANKM